MNYFLVVVVCMFGQCQGIWQDFTYVSKSECQIASQQAVEYFSTQLPDSNGEVYCLTESEFSQWKLDIENGIPPKLNENHPSNQKLGPEGTNT